MKNVMKFDNIKVGEVSVNLESAMKDYYNHYKVENGLTTKKLSYDTRDSLVEKDKKMHKILMSAIEQYTGQKKPELLSYAQWAMNPTVNYMSFALVGAMIDYVLPDTLIDSIGVYTDVRNGGLGDNFAFTVKPRDLFTVSQAGHGKRQGFIQKQFNTTKTLNPVNHNVTVGVALYKVFSGQESLGDFTAKAVRAIETQVTYDCYDAMTAAFSASNFPTTLKIANYSYSGAISLAQKVSAWNGGNKAIFVGTQLALSKIIPQDTNYRYLMDSDYVKMGYVKTIGNFDTLVLPQIADYSSTSFGLKLADNKIYVIAPSADKLVKLGLEGDTLSFVDNIAENQDLTQQATFQKAWDAQVITSAIAGEITLA